MGKRSLAVVLTVVLGLVAFAGLAAAKDEPARGGNGGDKGEATLNLIVSMPHASAKGGRDGSVADVLDTIQAQGDFIVDSFFDIAYLANIGSSGQDGVQTSRFSVDSFFDIEYRIVGDPDFDMLSISASGVIADPANPGHAVDTIREILAKSGGTVHYGHVTVLK